jgi:hypothetical protein
MISLLLVILLILVLVQMVGGGSLPYLIWVMALVILVCLLLSVFPIHHA